MVFAAALETPEHCPHCRAALRVAKITVEYEAVTDVEDAELGVSG